MNPENSPPAGHANAEIAALIETLLATELRLEELTAGQVDTVAGRDGRPFMLRRAQEQLRQSEAATLNELQVLFDLMPAMVWFKDTKDGILRVNQRVAEIAGKPIGEIQGKPSSATYPQEAARHYEDDLKVIRSGKPLMGIVETIRNREGEEIWIRTDKVPYCDRDGKVVGIVVMAQDITEHRQAEKALRESNEKFHQLADNLSDAFWIRSPDMREVRYISPAFERIWGRSVESLYANPQLWPDLILPEDRKRVLEAFATFAEDFPNLEIEYRIVRPDGEVRSVYLRASQVRDAAGKVICLTGIVTDITERTKTREAMQESEERFSSAFEHASIGMALVAPDGRWLKVNRAVCDLVGYAEAELLSRTFQDITHPEDLEVDLENVRRVIAGEIRSYQMEKRYVHRGGHFITVLLSVSLVRDGQGRPLHFISQIQDITERKQAEAALEQAHQELVETSRRAGMAEVATGVLHNVGNVLNSVNVTSSCLADSLRNSKTANLSKVVAMLREHEGDLGTFLTHDPKGRQLPAYLTKLAGHLVGEQAVALQELAGLQKNIEHIKDIVTMQQSFAKVSGVVETVQVTELVEDALRMNSSSFARHDIQVVRDFASLPPIAVEKHKVLQILVNLVRNAKEACDRPECPDKRLTVRVTGVKERVQIAVLDHGVGIAAENLTRIFSHGFTTKQDGHGFGLHSGANTARELGGSLTATSEGPGRGATFTLELPVSHS